MTAEEIIEGNKLIAEFLWSKQGNPEDRAPEWYLGEDLPYCDEDGYYQNVGAMNPISLEIIQFHSSWDWLMPVVEKIQHLEDELPVKIDFQIHLLGAVELYIDYKRVFAMTAFEPGTLINAVYEAILEFIKWYNENK